LSGFLSGEICRPSRPLLALGPNFFEPSPRFRLAAEISWARNYVGNVPTKKPLLPFFCWTDSHRHQRLVECLFPLAYFVLSCVFPDPRNLPPWPIDDFAPACDDAFAKLFCAKDGPSKRSLPSEFRFSSDSINGRSVFTSHGTKTAACWGFARSLTAEDSFWNPPLWMNSLLIIEAVITSPFAQL